MGRKGKANKHTAKEINGKHKAAKEARGAAGHGAAGATNRKNAGQAVAVQCKVCLMNQPTMASLTAHYDGKHRKVNFEEVKGEYEALFAANKAAAKGNKPGVGGGGAKKKK